MKKNILISTGGTGGHVIPALILFDHLNQEFNVILSTDKRGKKFINKNKHSYHLINVSNLENNIMLFPLKALSFLSSLMKSFYLIKKKKINIIFSTGGYMSLPVCIVGKLLGIDIFLFEPNAILGKSNLFLIKYAKKVICYYSEIKNFPNLYKKKIKIIEPLMRKSTYISKKNLNLNFKNQINIVVIGGSQGAEFFDNISTELFKNLSKKIKINVLQQVSNINKYKEIQNIYETCGINYKLFKFDENLTDILGGFNLALTRCGASTMAELVQLNVPFIGIPFPYAKDDHQYLNAIEYEKKNCCWIFRQKKGLDLELLNLIFKISKNDHIYKDKYESTVKVSNNNNWNKINKKLIEIVNEY